MISVERQQKLLLNVSRELTKRITVYAVGGTAMMFLGIKDATLDIDLVFQDAESKEEFKQAAKKLGYGEMDAIKVYGTKRNTPDMLTLGDERFDLFVNDVIDFVFSEKMQDRTVDTHQFGDKLLLKVANPHDLILMKCATDRVKDKDDVRSIMQAKKINWDILIEEAKHQVSLGKERAFFELGCFLENMKEKMGEDIPVEVLDTLFELVKDQADEKQLEMAK